MDMYGSDIEFSRWKELCVSWQSYYLRQIYHKNSNRTIRQFSIQSGNSVWLAGSAFCLYGCITVLFLLAFNEFAWISLTPTEPTQEQAEQSLQDRRYRVWKFSCKLCFNLTSSEVFAIQPTTPWWFFVLEAVIFVGSVNLDPKLGNPKKPLVLGFQPAESKPFKSWDSSDHWSSFGGKKETHPCHHDIESLTQNLCFFVLNLVFPFTTFQRCVMFAQYIFVNLHYARSLLGTLSSTEVLNLFEDLLMSIWFVHSWLDRWYPVWLNIFQVVIELWLKWVFFFKNCLVLFAGIDLSWINYIKGIEDKHSLMWCYWMRGVQFWFLIWWFACSQGISN